MKKRWIVLSVVILAVVMNMAHYKVWYHLDGQPRGPGRVDYPVIRIVDEDKERTTAEAEARTNIPCGANLGMSMSGEYYGWPLETYSPVGFCDSYAAVYVGSVIGNTILASGVGAIVYGIIRLIQRRKS